MYSITAIVPVYNEEIFVIKSLKRLEKIYEITKIIIINDCSTDNSKTLIENFIKDNQRFTLYNLPENRGKGKVLSFSKKLIDTSHVVIHDADLEYFPEDLTKLIKLSKQYPNELILGSRFIGFEERKNIYLRTYMANKIMSLFFSFIHNVKLSDIATCYKLLPSNFFRDVNINEDGFSIEVELVAKYLKTNKFFKEVPIKYEGRSYKDGKKIKVKDGFKYLYCTIKYRIINQ